MPLLPEGPPALLQPKQECADLQPKPPQTKAEGSGDESDEGDIKAMLLEPKEELLADESEGKLPEHVVSHAPNDPTAADPALPPVQDNVESCQVLQKKVRHLERLLEWYQDCRDWVAANGKDSGFIDLLVSEGKVPLYLRWDGEMMSKQ